MKLRFKEGRAWRAGAKALRKKFNSSRLAGVEWEFNEPPSLKALTKWTHKWRAGVHYDGSCGREAVTPPLAGDRIKECLTDLHKAFKRDRARMNRDCSVHVHIDASDFDWNELYRLLWVYSHLEDLLFKKAGDKRRRSHWCRPCGKKYRRALTNRFNQENTTSLSVNNLDNLLEKNKVLNVAYNASNGFNRWEYARRKDEGRYQALNLCPWLYAKRTGTNKQTIEFRLHENTSSLTRVVNWTHLLVRIVDWARKATNEQVKNLPPPKQLLSLISAS